jgi:mRNA-degrading endonuclease YafQ of YafQ-DinJ toxin-antitoxin module
MSRGHKEVTVRNELMDFLRASHDQEPARARDHAALPRCDLFRGAHVTSDLLHVSGLGWRRQSAKTWLP